MMSEFTTSKDSSDLKPALIQLLKVITSKLERVTMARRNLILLCASLIITLEIIYCSFYVLETPVDKMKVRYKHRFLRFFTNPEIINCSDLRYK